MAVCLRRGMEGIYGRKALPYISFYYCLGGVSARAIPSTCGAPRGREREGACCGERGEGVPGPFRGNETQVPPFTGKDFWVVKPRGASATCTTAAECSLRSSRWRRTQNTGAVGVLNARHGAVWVEVEVNLRSVG